MRHTLGLHEYKKIMEYVNLHEGAFTKGHSHKIKVLSKRCKDSTVKSTESDAHFIGSFTYSVDIMIFSCHLNYSVGLVHVSRYQSCLLNFTKN